MMADFRTETQTRFQLFSPLADDKYAALKADIEQNGVLVPVEVDQHGQVLDGHHRIKAWNELKTAGVSVPDYPRVIRSFDNDDDREEHAAKLNSNRRDISTDDKKRLALRWRERGWSYRRIGGALGVTHVTVMNWVPAEESGGKSLPPEQPERVIGADGKSYAATKPRPAVWASSAKDEERALTSMDALFSEDGDDESEPITVDRNTGEILTTSQMAQRAAQRKRELHNAELSKASNAPMPIGKFRCIVLDPPWPVQKIERDKFPNQGKSLDYPVMPLEDIAALPVGNLGDDDAHMYLWVTQKYLPAGISMLEQWGFRYQCLMTWVKPSGFTPFSWMYNTEHVIFGRRGSLDLMRMGLKLSFEAPNPKHSAKPDVFYERVIQASPGPRLEMFARQPREGFIVWGNESGEVADGVA